MKSILTALKTAIGNGMTGLRGVYVLPDPDLLPPAAQLPCVGLKDSGSAFSEGVGESQNEASEIQIYIYVQLLQGNDASIMGVDNVAPALDVKGILDLMDDLRTLLNFNTLGDLVEMAFIPSVAGSETFLRGENVLVQRKGCVYQYERSL
jgi:hypothetical protein